MFMLCFLTHIEATTSCMLLLHELDALQQFRKVTTQFVLCVSMKKKLHGNLCMCRANVAQRHRCGLGQVIEMSRVLFP